jgi:hypothetical protein
LFVRVRAATGDDAHLDGLRDREGLIERSAKAFALRSMSTTYEIRDS